MSSLLQFVNPEMPGYVGFANLPNQVHRKSVKRGFEFTLMVVGKLNYSSVNCSEISSWFMNFIYSNLNPSERTLSKEDAPSTKEKNPVTKYSGPCN